MSLLRARMYSKPRGEFVGTMEIGSLCLGWILRAPRDIETRILKEWPFTTRHTRFDGGIRIPFPDTESEWADMRLIFSRCGISIPFEERSKAEKSLENSKRRFELSSSTGLADRLVVPEFYGDLKPFQDVGVVYAQSMGWRAVIGDDMGLGKAQPLTSRIKTPNGWVRMGDVLEGDYVLTHDGSPTKVTGIFERGVLDAYTLVFGDGSKTQSCLEHLWEVFEGPDTRDDSPLVMTLSRIIELFQQRSFYVRHVDGKRTRLNRIENSPATEMRCISVDHSSHLYVTDDDLVTHNTWQGLASMVASGANRTVIITRSVAVEGWHRAIRKLTTKSVRVGAGTGSVDVLKSGRLPKMGPGDHPEDYVPLDIRLPKDMREGKKSVSLDLDLLRTSLPLGLRQLESGVIVLSYDLLTAWENEIRAWNPDMMILDEIHAIKEPESKRSIVAHALIEDIQKVVGLTGTFMPNRPRELYHILSHMYPGKYGDWFAYAKQFCDAKLVTIGYEWKTSDEKISCPLCGKQKSPNPRCKRCSGKGWDYKKIRGDEKKAWDYDGASNMEVLYKKLRSYGMARRMKDDVLDLMPPTQETIPLEASKRYRDVESGFLEIVDGNFNPMLHKKDEVAMHQLFAAAAADKIEWSKEWLGAFLEDTDEKIVVFFHHQLVGDSLAAYLKEQKIDFVSLYGSSPEKGGDVRFQNDKKCRVSLCSYGVAREAVTLTEASYFLGVEYAWVPTWMDQAMDRIRRMGQLRACNYYFPVLRNTVEERMVCAMLDKQDVISVAMQGSVRRNIEIAL